MTSLLTRAFGWLLAGLLLAAGLVFTASLAVAALLLGGVAVAASLLRGEKPSLRHLHRGFGRGRRAAPPAEIVDVEVREVPETPQPIEHNSEPPRIG
jgi:uncharacterized protein (DUF58 family)